MRPFVCLAALKIKDEWPFSFPWRGIPGGPASAYFFRLNGLSPRQAGHKRNFSPVISGIQLFVKKTHSENWYR
ncbi:hypothetical protein C6Y45_03765 [Alkalicoccus saliphilus]|jgi:hypothetical protein|uniref:Uncharacterized protein n=1 Tax=Alkalicoccus saliphilus TaxID=200989 RepID=A0A2T4U8R8_9BACI|nr:hypothetical protein C6Y45_03765 [Alkalicoccus saliphilus]